MQRSCAVPASPEPFCACTRRDPSPSSILCANAHLARETQGPRGCIAARIQEGVIHQLTPTTFLGRRLERVQHAVRKVLHLGELQSPIP